MTQNLNLDTWNRRDHFHFFRQFEEPFFGVTVQMDCTKAYAYAKKHDISFFLHYLYQSLRAANQVEPFRYRIVDEGVQIHDQVHASPTINRPDGSFGFAYMDYDADEQAFMQKASAETERVRNSTGLVPSGSGQNVIHYSALPGISFLSVSHARRFSFNDSCPKISFGKLTDEHGKKMMPVSVHAHHALMDAYHVEKFIELYQQLLNEK